MRILSICGDPVAQARYTDLLQGLGHVACGIGKRNSVRNALNESEFDAVVIWDDLPAGYARSLAGEIRRMYRTLFVLCISEFDGKEISLIDKLSNGPVAALRAA